ncbi:LysR substrate-binding domain-containing protein [Bradyrhizobium sp. CCGB12]|uniref:LysR substrate-binding domain-containing protein n=1 Tax=Bradyrhizobium sp. CCGB12 TaxID=2949632 RepID=UPI0020B3A16A|nr:LysR substrate-binding domain-containing protein [Bradyrhizobium sp. CCGB12]MCP3394974.1 LysR substrate-binding domain-containing protein [Bradyrhizobium sp. CCGB12]
MSLRQLRAFKTVAEAGGIREAARRLQLTQPAVTHAVRELERGLGATLFIRSSAGVQLTEIGAALLQRAHLVLSEVQRTHDEITQLRDGTGGQLCVAVSSAAATYALAPAVSAFRKLRPGVAIELHELTWAATDERWRNGFFDFAVVSEVGDAADEWERELLFQMPLAIVVRAKHPLVRTRSIHRLADSMWAVPTYGPEVLRRIFEANQAAPPRDIMVCQTLAVLLPLVRQIDAVGIVSGWLFRNRAAAQGLIPLGYAHLLPKARVSIVMRDSSSLTPAARLFRECLKESAGSIGT